MDISNISSGAVSNLSLITDGALANAFNVTENFVGNLTNHVVKPHINVSYGIVTKLGNITKEGITSIVRATDDVGICDFIISNETSGNVTTTVASYSPAACGLYGSYPPIQPLLIFILVCFTLWAIFGNSCLMGVIITDKNMQEPGNIFLCALSLTDVALSFMHTPVAIYSLVHGKSLGGTWCRAQAFFAVFLSNLSIYLQTSLWICRYVHIAYPYKYQTLLKRGRLALAMAVCFLIALAPPLVGITRVGTWTVDFLAVDIAEPISIMMPCWPGGTEGPVAMGLALLCVIISCCFAGLIYREARNSQKKHNQKQAWLAQADKLENKIKAAKTLGIVVGVQWVTWIPALTTSLLGRFGVISLTTAAFAGDITYVIWLTSTFSDSIVYAFRNKIYRRGLAKIYRKIRNAMNVA